MCDCSPAEHPTRDTTHGGVACASACISITQRGSGLTARACAAAAVCTRATVCTRARAIAACSVSTQESRHQKRSRRTNGERGAQTEGHVRLGSEGEGGGAEGHVENAQASVSRSPLHNRACPEGGGAAQRGHAGVAQVRSCSPCPNKLPRKYARRVVDGSPRKNR